MASVMDELEIGKNMEIQTKKLDIKVQEIRKATHSFQSEKFLHHCVQRVSKPRKTYLVK
jgi:hypothetical protein